MGVSLSGGFVENGIVTCPWHACAFGSADGAWADNPRIKIGCYPSRWGDPPGPVKTAEGILCRGALRAPCQHSPPGTSSLVALRAHPSWRRAWGASRGGHALRGWGVTRDLALFLLDGLSDLLPCRGKKRESHEASLYLAGPAPAARVAHGRAVPILRKPLLGPRLGAVAENSLLIEGLTNVFRGLSRSLKERPADVDTWVFARGQALLLAESGNLLMLRRPCNQGENAWMQQAADLRDRRRRAAPDRRRAT